MQQQGQLQRQQHHQQQQQEPQSSGRVLHRCAEAQQSCSQGKAAGNAGPRSCSSNTSQLSGQSASGCSPVSASSRVPLSHQRQGAACVLPPLPPGIVWGLPVSGHLLARVLPSPGQQLKDKLGAFPLGALRVQAWNVRAGEQAYGCPTNHAKTTIHSSCPTPTRVSQGDTAAAAAAVAAAVACGWPPATLRSHGRPSCNPLIPSQLYLKNSSCRCQTVTCVAIAFHDMSHCPRLDSAREGMTGLTA
eukprot:497216-Pelagomonas_calceolata.AAC.1